MPSYCGMSFSGGVKRRWALVSAAVACMISLPASAVGPGTIDSVVGGTFEGDEVAATDAVLRPFALAADSTGRVVMVDGFRVRGFHVGGNVATLAGNGAYGFSGDGGPATSGSVGPSDVAVDAAGAIYIADQWNLRVRKVGTDGVLTTLAGDGGYGDWGDGGPATAAAFRDPAAVAVDPAGFVYVSDGLSNTVRRISPTGVITRVAGGGRGPLGDGLPATLATLNAPRGLAFDPEGNLLIADTGNLRVRKVSKATGLITTVAGSGTCCSGNEGPALLSAISPYDIATDDAGTLYVAERGGVVHRVDPSGFLTRFAGGGGPGFSGDGGPATLASLDYTASIAVGTAGTVLIADLGNGRVRAVSPAGVISTVAGGGAMSVGDGRQARFAAVVPGGVAFDGHGNMFVADGGNNRVRKVDSSGIISTVAGTGIAGFGGDGGPATAAHLNGPWAIAVDGAGALYVAELRNDRVRRIDVSGVITTVAGTGVRGYAGDGGPATAAALSMPSDVAVDGAGNVYIADRGNNRVRRIDSAGTITTVAGDGRYGFSGDGGPATAASLAAPAAVEADASGAIVVADTDNHRVRHVAGSGTITTVAGNGTAGFGGDGGPASGATLYLPYDLARRADGTLYIADLGNFRIRRIDAAAVISTVAGTGDRAVGGDGGPATAASFLRPERIGVDGAGNVYVSDYLRTRRIAAPV